VSTSQAKQPSTPTSSGQTAWPTAESKKATHGKHKKNKRMVRLDSENQIPPISDEPACENSGDEDKNRRVLRYAELEADSRPRSPKPHHARRKARKTPVALDKSPVAGDEYRKKIEAMRNEAGSGWLRVLNEMEDHGKSKP
jgi:hypothetical protein